MPPVTTMAFITPACTKRATDFGPPPARRARGRVGAWPVWVWAPLLVLCLVLSGVRPVHAASIEQLSLTQDEEGLFVSSVVDLKLGPAVEEALLRSVPVYFVVQADVFRERWYWADRRVASASRTYRLAYQSLTRRWRLSVAAGAGPGLQYALHQNHGSLAEAMSVVTRVSSWLVAESPQLDASAKHRLDFRFKLDMALLPRPFQLGLGGQSDWSLDLRQTLAVPLAQAAPSAPPALTQPTTPSPPTTSPAIPATPAAPVTPASALPSVSAVWALLVAQVAVTPAGSAR